MFIFAWAISKCWGKKINDLPAIKLEELTGVELAAIPAAGAPLPWSLTMGSTTHKQYISSKWSHYGGGAVGVQGWAPAAVGIDMQPEPSTWTSEANYTVGCLVSNIVMFKRGINDLKKYETLIFKYEFLSI